MGLLSFYRRHFTKQGRRWAKRDKMSRVDYLLAVHHDWFDAPCDGFGGLNYPQFFEQQLAEGKTDLALSNMRRLPKHGFELANLYWGKGDLEKAEQYLRKTLQSFSRYAEAVDEHGGRMHEAKAGAGVKAAALFLGEKLDRPLLTSQLENCYQPWFKNTLLDYCLGKANFDQQAWQDAEDAWLKKRHPKYKLAEYGLYLKALTGGFDDDAQMLNAHEKMWVGKAKRNPDAGFLEGYHDNELIVDFLFAAILKRISWEGSYRHSWPNTCPVGTAPVTTRPADRFVKIIKAAAPAAAAQPDIIEDDQQAQQFIDAHVPGQTSWYDDEALVVLRPPKEQGKVAEALAAIGWDADEATLDLMRTYRVDKILNDSAHIMLSDPIGDRYTGLRNWNGLLSEEFGLHPDFIAIAESEDKRDYRDPQGAWYVYWKKDRRIYAVQRDDWDKPEEATREAKSGISLWPSYPSFVAWWVAQHLEGKR